MGDTRDNVVNLINTKLRVKKEVFAKTKEVFALLKKSLNKTYRDLSAKKDKDNPVEVKVTEIGSYEIRIKVGGDTIVFLMHSNVFDFEDSHKTKKLSYVREDPMNSFCGQIYVYNFLDDSFKYNRSDDLGYLIARVFVNKDKHYFVEGNQRLSFLFNDFSHAVLDKSNLAKLIDEVIAYCLDFDLHTPPFLEVSVVTVSQINQASQEQKIQTGKRLGFKFKSDNSL
jgi:hypothetical protein